jgi:hypothetical protein
MGNICIKQKLKRKIHPINLSHDNTLKLTSLKNNFFNIEDNFPDKHDIENYRKLYLQDYYSYTNRHVSGIRDISGIRDVSGSKEICIRPSTAHSRNKFNINS